MKRQKKIVLTSIVVIFSTILMIFPTTPFHSNSQGINDNDHELKSASILTTTKSLLYNDYYAVSGNSDDYISWSFDGSSSNIDVHVLIMDSSRYAYFVNDVIGLGLDTTVNGNYLKVSSGTESHDSGEYEVPHSSTWYVIFANVDEDQESTRLDIVVEWDPIYIPFLSDFLGFPLIFTGVFSIIIFFILCGVVSSSKHKRKPLSTDNKNNPYIPITQLPDEFRYFYCLYCGEKLTIDSVFCSRCGSKLKKKK